MPDRADGEPSALNIEAMTPADWESVRAIYREGIATGHATFEADAPDWETWDRGRLKDAHIPELNVLSLGVCPSIAFGP